MESLSDDELVGLINYAEALKRERKDEGAGQRLAGRVVALVFEKASTRTRCAAVVGAAHEGGHAEYLDPSATHLGGKESVPDTARVLGRMFDGILFRGYDQATLEGLAKHAGVPVWNGLTDESHPTQILADLMTLRERFGRLKGLKLVYMGDGRNNVANSLMLGCAKAGVNFVNCTPEALNPSDAHVEQARAIAERNGATVEVEHDPATAAVGAHCIYTDVWVSMGEEDAFEERVRLLRPYQVNAELVAATGRDEDDFLFLHCLPAFHNTETQYSAECGALEVTDDVFEAPYSWVFDQAENRMHTLKALMVSTIGTP